MEKGCRRALVALLSAIVPTVAGSSALPYEIKAGEEWIPLDVHRDIEPGSAFDFSQMGFVDAPAGKHGWLRNVDGHFEFEALPGKAQRFYGVNLVGTANFPDYALADTLVTRFRRLGYNAIRIHHHDAGSVEGSTDGLTLNSANMDRLDYLLAAAIREGLYVTTDLYASRAHAIQWRHIGVDRDGTVDMQLFKALCAVYEPAFENWAAYARKFLEHKNRFTGRRYLDEPAIPLISLVNEGWMAMGWGRGVRTDPRILDSWRNWLAGKREADPSFAPGVDGDRLPEDFKEPKSYAAIAQWSAELEARMVSRMTAYLRDLGCKALLTNNNCGPHYAALQRADEGLDYIDDHFYVDHPIFIGKPWQLPSQCQNGNPLLDNTRIAPSHKAYTRIFGKPFTISEWNFCGPGRYRGVGGILAGAMAALQGWDGLWRFAYAHSSDNLGDSDYRRLSYFNLSGDPLAQASERACLCLFLRGDIAPLSQGVALLVTPESVTHGKVLPAAPEWSDSAWRMRAGSCLAPEAAGGLCVIRREDAESEESREAVRALETQTPLRFDRRRGAFTICAPRTCGGFAPEGEIDAGALKAFISGAPATVWVHSLDDNPICRSRRLLLTHLTDVQGDGAAFEDESMRKLLEWGGAPVARAGTAEITLSLDEPERYAVYGLATSGRRMMEIPAAVEGRTLRFAASVAAPGGARLLYEIARMEE